jgi:prepilin-type N-terminal cleavage/methylation domain-containing protein
MNRNSFIVHKQIQHLYSGKIMNTNFKTKLLLKIANKKANKGFTLIELLVNTIIVGILAISAVSFLGQIFLGRSFAENQLRDHVNSVLREDLKGANCQAIDSDGNGYVSCDYTVVSRPQETRPIECAAWGWYGLINRGCRTRFPNFPNR